MANKIKIKQSSVSAKVPLAADLEQGELAINTLDEKLYTKNSTNVVVQLGITDAQESAITANTAKISYNSTDSTKLGLIEASADVTDVTNVTAAGALMDSELAGIAAVKATTGTFLTADQTKLDGIETSATADQTSAEIKTAYEANANSNEFSDAEQTKLSGIAASANNYSHPANHTISVTTGLQAALDGKTTESYVDSQITTLIGGAPSTLNDLNELAAAINDDAAYASTLTTALGTKTAKTSNQSLSSAANAMTISGHTITLNRGDSTTDTVIVPDNNTTYSVGDGGLSQINFTSADNTKLDGIETGATADQTQSDINALGITATSVDLGNWTITESSGVMYFATGGTNKAKLDASGNFTVVGDVTAFGTI